MSAIFSLLFGPLAAPECKRSARRESTFVWRPILAIILGVVALSVTWFTDVIVRQFQPNSQPFSSQTGGLQAIETLMIVTALLLSPAGLAGSLAGEKERGAMGLLLTSRVTAYEIVMGRLAGKLCQVEFVLLGALPLLALIGAQVGIHLPTFATLLILPMAVAFGGGGIALAASSVSKRGRNAMLLVYLLDVLLLLAPVVSDALSYFLWEFNPGLASPLDGEMLTRLIWLQDLGPAWTTIAIWTLFGIAGVTLASWRVRPSTLNASGGKTRLGKAAKRPWIVPAVGNDPMLWKELFIERVGSIGVAGRVLGVLLVLYLVGASAYAVCYRAWGLRQKDDALLRLSEKAARELIAIPAWLVSVLIIVSVGLRASATIAAERERGTWDSILTSPLEGIEIVRGKLWGSLHALRWLIVAAFGSWAVACFAKGMAFWDFANLSAETLIIGVFASALGIRSSLKYSTATRAMSATIVILLIVHAVAAAVAALIVLTLGFLVLAFLSFLQSIPVFSALLNNLPPFSFFWTIALVLSYLGISLSLIASTALRFDRLAGRMTGGALAGAVDRFIHGGKIDGPIAVGKSQNKLIQKDNIEIY